MHQHEATVVERGMLLDQIQRVWPPHILQRVPLTNDDLRGSLWDQAPLKNPLIGVTNGITKVPDPSNREWFLHFHTPIPLDSICGGQCFAAAAAAAATATATATATTTAGYTPSSGSGGPHTPLSTAEEGLTVTGGGGTAVTADAGADAGATATASKDARRELLGRPAGRNHQDLPRWPPRWRPRWPPGTRAAASHASLAVAHAH